LSCGYSLAYELKVIDGDTIILNGDKIRFSGIDTSESYYRFLWRFIKENFS
jgi:endonuclease YncB( thermonuclease family)